MGKLIFHESIIVGGLLDLNDQNIFLRSLQINDGLFIHTCNDYSKSLEVIKKSSYGIQEKVKILSKVYYKYPDINHRRYRPIIEQLEEIRNRLGFNPSFWEIQICCYCPIYELISDKAQLFFEKIKKIYGITNIFLEIYPIYNYSSEKVSRLNNLYEGISRFNLMGYQNAMNRVFTENNLKKFAKDSLNLIFIGILGKGIQNNIRQDVWKNYHGYDFIDINLFYFLAKKKDNSFIKGITNTSSIGQYKNLKVRFLNVNKTLENSFSYSAFEDKFKLRNYYFYKYDHYGGFIPIWKYLIQPKTFFSKLKYIFISFIKSKKFSYNFFG